MSDPVIDSRLAAWRSARSVTATVFGGSFLTMAAWHFVRGDFVWQWFAAFVLSLLALVVVLANRQLSVRGSTACTLFTMAVAMTASALSTYDMAANGLRFEAFNGHKLAAFVAAIIAPFPFWSGYLIIAVAMVAPVIQYFAMPVAMRDVFAVQEPWFTTVASAVALFVLIHRLRALGAERATVRAIAERQNSDQIARMFLAMRDLTNTPLQSITLTSALLQAKHIDQQQAAEHLEKALARLRELTAVLSRYDHVVDWTTTTASFDAVKDLDDRVRSDRTT